MFEPDLLVLALSSGLSLHLIGDNVMLFEKREKMSIVSFHDAWWARISITTQYDIYAIIEQVVT